MRLPFVDRALLGCFFLCALLLATGTRVFGACDTKCRQIKIYFEDEGRLGINCYNWDLIDCQVCDNPNGFATCRDVNPPGANTCRGQLALQQYSPATGCTLQCNLPLGSYAEATGNIGNNFKAGGNQWLCQP